MIMGNERVQELYKSAYTELNIELDVTNKELNHKSRLN